MSYHIMWVLTPPILYVYLKSYIYVDGMFDVVFTKLNFSSGNYVVKFVYQVCALSQMSRCG